MLSLHSACQKYVHNRHLSGIISGALHGTWPPANCADCADPLLQVLSSLQGVNLSVESLHAAMQRVRSEVLQPYGTIRMQTTQMSNLHRTTDMLRHVLHRLKLVAKLKVRIWAAVCTADIPLTTKHPVRWAKPLKWDELTAAQRGRKHVSDQKTSQALTELQGACTCLHSLGAASMGGIFGASV